MQMKARDDAMNSAATVLKQEIRQTMEEEHDLAKWKLFVVAALGAAAFGLFQNNPKHWLLLFVPFVCAYIDLYAYQYQIRIAVIAEFLRSDAAVDEALQRYELKCGELAGKGAFSLGIWAGIGSSLGMCASGPVLYLLRHLYYLQHRQTGPDYLQVPIWWAAGIWLVGVLLIVSFWAYFKYIALPRVRKAREGGAPGRSKAAAPGCTVQGA